MLEDQRKRRIELSAPNGPTARKKPMLTSNNTNNTLLSSNPEPTSGERPSSDDEPPQKTINSAIATSADEDQLENFRKEALWRQLQEHKRDLRRAQDKIEQSETLKSDAEARLAAIDVCWNQLIEDVRLLFKDSFSGLDPSTSPALTSLPSSPTQLDRALHQRSTASKDLILHLISLASSSSVASPDLEEVRSRCRQLTAESASSRVALGLAESKLKQLQDQLETAEEATRRAEKKLDRERSRTVRALYAQGQGGSTSQKTKPESCPSTNDSIKPGPVPQLNGTLNQSSLGSPTTNGDTPAQQDSNKDNLDLRSQEIMILRAELLRRAHEIDILHWKMVNLPDEIVQDTASYKQLKAEMAHATVEVERARGLLETAQKEADDLREKQEEYRTSIVSDLSVRLEDMEKKLLAKDADVTRIRSTREEARSELHELKSRDAEKMRQVAQIRTLANSRQDRINALSSEVRRLKMCLAADVGDGATVAYLASTDEIDILKGLQDRLKKSEETINILTLKLKELAETAQLEETTCNLVKSEALARAALVPLKERVAYLEEVLGGGSDPNVAEMAQKLQVEIDRQKALEAKIAAQEASAAMLYTEVDRLSTAWAALDEQNRDKVFKLAEHDEKVLKAVHEKAKADNRYFSAMRANETLKNQTTVLEKMAEKQTTTISKLSDELRAVCNRLSSAEREITIHQKLVEGHKLKLSELSIQNAQLTDQCQQHDTKMGEISIVLRDRTTQIESEAVARRAAEESVMSLEKELQKLKARTQNGDGKMIDSTEVAELKSFNEDLTKMLKCNSCKQRFKSHVITRCMHLFCQACLDARLETRQRKCPTCSIAFGTNDVAAVYF